jgi:hypothetical protein
LLALNFCKHNGNIRVSASSRFCDFVHVSANDISKADKPKPIAATASLIKNSDAATRRS